MSLFSKLLGTSALFVLISLVLYVIFGQVTVRKLRKNSETKDELGIEFASGWDILNVAQALTVPRWLNRKFMKSTLSAFAANAEILNKHTNRFDKILAKLFYGLFITSTFSMILLVLLDALGLFN